MRSLREAFRLEAVPQILLVGVTLLLALLIVASSAEYVSVAQAHALASLSVAPAFTFQGLDPSGNLTENGSVTYTLTATVSNPSPRVLRFEQLIYRAWIEDAPMEAGLTGLNRMDQAFTNGTGVHEFFLTFVGPTGLNPTPVPAGGSAATVLTFILTKTSASAEFEAVRNITAYARAHGVPLSAIPWNLYTWMSLTIDGVPFPASTSSADYLRADARVILQAGNDLSVQGVPGFGA